MAKKRHGGLGRGLDALIPKARPTETEKTENAERTAEKAKGKQEGKTDTKESTHAVTGDIQEKVSGGTQKIASEGTQEKASEGTQEKMSEGTQEKMSGGTQEKASEDTQGRISESAQEEGPESVQKEGPESGRVKSSGEDIPGAETVKASEGILTDPEEARETAEPENKTAAETNFSAETEKTASEAEKTGGVRMLRLSQVDPNRKQPRTQFEEEALEELADSIRQFGVLQPILVQKKGIRYEIIAGERRWRAARKAGLREIPAIVREYSDQEAVELSLIENIQRQDLNPIEEAKAFKRLLDEFGLRQEDLAARVSKSRTAITNAVRLLKLDERVQDMIVQGELSMGHARALIPVEIPEEQALIAREVADRHLSVREVEKLVKKRLAGGSGGKTAGGKKQKEAVDPALELAYKAIEKRLAQALGTKTTVRYAGDGTGKLEIEFYSHEDLEKIVDLLT